LKQKLRTLLAINKDMDKYLHNLQKTRKCTGNSTHRSSLKRRPTKILHLSGGRQAASKGTVLSTRLSCKNKKLLLSKIKEGFYELLMCPFTFKFFWLQTQEKIWPDNRKKKVSTRKNTQFWCIQTILFWL